MAVGLQVGFVVQLFLSFTAEVRPEDHPPATAASAAPTNSSIELTFPQTPVTDQSVNDFVDLVRRELRKAKEPAELLQRDAYVKELVRALKRFAVKDWMRRNGSRPAEGGHFLSDRTSARVIRLLGDLNAVEAVDTLAEHLLVPPDSLSEIVHKAGVRDMPTSWVLFQLGDCSLPSLRRKLTSDAYFIRVAASRAAAYILGPRAADELQRWIDQAETEDLRERLQEHSPYFTAATANATAGNRLFTPEEYRRTTLERDRAYLERVLDRPGPISVEPME